MESKTKGLVILVRGISGSGKSTHVEELRQAYAPYQDFTVCSVDKFFMRTRLGSLPMSGGPEYNFDPTKLAEAHSECMSNFIMAIRNGKQVIVVDNTFIHQWEMDNYVSLARMSMYDVEIHEIRIKTIDELRQCVARNIHRVPAEAVARKAIEFEPLDDSVLTLRVIPFKRSKE